MSSIYWHSHAVASRTATPLRNELLREDLAALQRLHDEFRPAGCPVAEPTLPPASICRRPCPPASAPWRAP